MFYVQTASNPKLLNAVVSSSSILISPKISKKINNILPNKYFSYVFFKKVYTTLSSKKLHLNFIPVYHNTLIRFMEYISGNKVLVQFYPFVSQSITTP